MAKRPSIIDRLEEAERSEAETAARPPLRVAKDVLKTSVYVPTAAHDRLREIAFIERVKVHDLIMEGIDRVIQDRGHAEKASRKAKAS
jgi:hypothetical protein